MAHGPKTKTNQGSENGLKGGHVQDVRGPASGRSLESQSKPGITMVYPKSCKEAKGRLPSWGSPLLTFGLWLNDFRTPPASGGCFSLNYVLGVVGSLSSRQHMTLKLVISFR